MKRILRLSTALVIVIAFTMQAGSTASAANSRDRKQNQQSYQSYRGTVVDSETGTPLIFATVSLQGSNIATVTNLDGEFSIKISNGLKDPVLEVFYIGYKNVAVSVSELRGDGKDNTIRLVQATIPIREVIVKPITPDEIMNEVIKNISKNYVDIPNLMTSFYRETIKRNRNYVSIAEAVVEVFKAPYNNDYRFDMAKVYKGRKNVQVSRLDTVLFRLQGGPITTLQLDIVKNPEAILNADALVNYIYTLESIISIDEKPHYVIRFSQKPEIDVPYFLGRLYIDVESYALSEAEFSINLEDQEKASELFIRKKPLGMKVLPEMASYRVKFREQDKKWYFSYGRAEVKFKVNWERKLFNTNYTTMSEIAVTDRTAEQAIKFEAKERLKKGDIFTEQLSAFTDPDFWGDYNVIEPDQSIESAIRRLARKLRFDERNND